MYFVTEKNFVFQEQCVVLSYVYRPENVIFSEIEISVFRNQRAQMRLWEWWLRQCKGTRRELQTYNIDTFLIYHMTYFEQIEAVKVWNLL